MSKTKTTRAVHPAMVEAEAREIQAIVDLLCQGDPTGLTGLTINNMVEPVSRVLEYDVTYGIVRNRVKVAEAAGKIHRTGKLGYRAAVIFGYGPAPEPEPEEELPFEEEAGEHPEPEYFEINPQLVPVMKELAAIKTQLDALYTLIHEVRRCTCG